MSKTLYGLTDSQVQRLTRLLGMIESGELERNPIRRQSSSYPDRVIVGALTAAAAATTALLGMPKVATLNVYTFSSTGTVDSGRDETVYNFAPQAATTDRWTVCERCSITGKWIITTQFCS